MKTKYYYSGPILLFTNCIQQKWSGETMASSKEEAIRNLEYQAKKQLKLMPTAIVRLGDPKKVRAYND